MPEQLTEKDLWLWNRYREAFDLYLTARSELFAHINLETTALPDEDSQIIQLVRRGLADSKQRSVAVETAALVAPEELKFLFDDLFPLAIEFDDKRPAGRSRAAELLLCLPKDWLKNRIQEYLDRLRLQPGFEMCTGLLSFCEDIDPNFALELAQEAMAGQSDYEKEIGAFFYKRLIERRNEPSS